jgi:N-acyl-D-aspartate/D-glutamate deacylase
MWGEEKEALRVIDEARKHGRDVTADIHMIMVGRSKLSSIIPPWWKKQGREKLIENLKNPETRKKIKIDLVKDWNRTGELPLFNRIANAGQWKNIELGGLYRKKMLQNEKNIGKNIAEIARLRGIDPFDALCELIIEENDDVFGLSSGTSQESIKNMLIKHPAFAMSSDSSSKAAEEPWTKYWAESIRDYCPYTYALREWVKNAQVLTLEEFIRKSTSLPARILGLRDRGLIAEGMYADLTIFNMDTIAPMSTYDDPHQYSKGVQYVTVNGQIVVDGGKHIGKLPGKFLRHSI